MSDECNGSGARENDAPTTSRDDDDNNNGARKRRCTIHGVKIQLCQTAGEMAASPPVFVSLEELMKATNDVTNMALAHEITLNKDFKFGKAKKADNSIEKKIQDVMHKAFWDLLRTELAEDPPNYSQAMHLLSEIKSELLQLLLPQHTRIKQQISEVLDLDLIEQQAVAGTLDFQQYAHFVISVMGKICAPIRDEKLAQLMQTSDVVEVFRGILETLELMRFDMANFTIDVLRPQIIANSVDYERHKFAEYLKFNEGALTRTKQWLKRHCTTGDTSEDFTKKVNTTLNSAYIELLEWDFQNNPFPETVNLDDARLIDLGRECRKLNLTGAILLLTYTQAGEDLCSIAEFKDQLKSHVLTLMEDYGKEEEEGKLKTFLETLSAKVKQDLMDAVAKYSVRVSDPQFTDLPYQITELANKDHKILCLLKQRIKQFLLDTMSSRTAEPMKIPTGFSTLQKEVTQLAGVFLRLTTFNRAVYEEYYRDIIEEFSK